MNPFHSATHDGIGQASHIEKLDLILLDERDDDFGAPLTDGIQVDVEVAIPVPASCLGTRSTR